MSGIHPEDAAAYAAQLHRDCVEISAEIRRIREALEKIAECLALLSRRGAR
jgi:hypothetical protein